jgi:mannan endo-1,4-beta-mannosidase
MTDLIFKNPGLDFASIHLYEKSSIDSPVNLHAAALATGLMVKSSIDSITDERPFLDSEHGPITYFRKNRKGLSEAFDDAYFLYMQWAHLASGAAGGGMRWPYRYPHTLTHGMRRAQHNMAAFVELIDWRNFRRKNISTQIKTNSKNLSAFGCADAFQAVIWLMKIDRHKKKNSPPSPTHFELWLPGFSSGEYRVHFWNTQRAELQSIAVIHDKSEMQISYTISDNLAIAIQKIT